MIPTERMHYRSRRGAVIPLLAIMMAVFVGLLAFSFDLGRMAVCRAQLQTAADAAALAGASALGTDNLIIAYSLCNQTSDITTARTRCQTFAQANRYDLNSQIAFTLDKTNDVDLGILTNPSDLGATFQTSGTVPFNSVRVRTFIDSSHGGNPKFLFAPILGQFSTPLQATATATVELHPIASTKVITGLRSPILPITMSLSDWEQMVGITGTDARGKPIPLQSALTDVSKFDPSRPPGFQVVPGSDGLPEQELYPGSNVTSSNNGLLQFGTGSHSNSVLSDEIANGPTSDQVKAQWPPDGTSPSFPFPIGVDPGWRASNFDDLAQAIGKVRLIPINDGTDPGNGGKGSYTIVAFAAVRIMTSDKGGKKNGSAMVQPAVIDDPTVIPSTTVSGSGQGGIPVVRLTR